MEKPAWRRRASRYVIDSPFLRLRADDIELPDGTVVSDYYVREARGFVVVLALTHDDRVVLVRQYRYGADSIHLELPAGTLNDGEDPSGCALRELAEETGFSVERCELAAEFFAEPVRSPAVAYVFIGTGAERAGAPAPDVTEHLEAEIVTVDIFRAMLTDGRIDTGSSIAAGYLALAKLGRL
jgi:ADP-ribose pyrophosphatase